MPRPPLNSGKNAPSRPPLNSGHSAANTTVASPSTSTKEPKTSSRRRDSSTQGAAPPRLNAVLGQNAIGVDELERLAGDYLLDCDYRLQSPRTVDIRRIYFRNLVWFLRHRGYSACSTGELRQFFAYLRHGHEEEGGRWGNPRWKSPVRPMTVKDYYVNLRCLFNWLVEDGALQTSPLDAIPKPTAPVEQVQPFTIEQIHLLLKAARRSTQPRRNEAIVLFLYDTGVRASELCHLTVDDIDLESRHARVLGKGNKARTVYFSRETARALSTYLRKPPRTAGSPVFLSRIGNQTTRNQTTCKQTTRQPSPGHQESLCDGQPMTRSALLKLISSLGKQAGLKAMKVSPHVFRHSAAIQLLRNGCDVYSLMGLLGHSSLEICQNYLKISQADLETQHRRHSPVESLGKRK